MIVKKAQTNPDTKVIIVGDLAVGKTSILNQFEKGEFSETVESTVGAGFVSRQVETSHGNVNLLMWDTAGQERYRSLIPMYSRNATAALLVVDVNNPLSVDSIEIWHSVLKEHCPRKCRIYVVANKIDLECHISMEKLEQWSKHNGFPFFKASAKRFETIEPIFKRVAEDMGSVNENLVLQQESILIKKETHTVCC